LSLRPALRDVSVVPCGVSRRIHALLPDNARYVLRKFPHARAAELQHHPASRQMLLLLVSYPLGLVLVPVDDG
jgi:hypothetical protein